MQLVSVELNSLAEVVLAYSAADGSLLLSHSDGTISRHNDQHQLVNAWLNPGMRIIALTVVNTYLLVVFDDRSARVISLETGLHVSSLETPFLVLKFAVFEHILVGWSPHDTKVCLLHRFNFECFQTIQTDSFVTNVFSASGGISVVGSSDIYWLRQATYPSHWEISSIYHSTSSLIIDACAVQRKWLLLTPGSWKLLDLEDGGPHLKVELEVVSPINTLFKAVSTNSKTTIIQCTDDKYVFIQDNNIQVLDSPVLLDHPEKCGNQDAQIHRNILVGNALQIITPDLHLYRAAMMKNGEFQWQLVDLSTPLASQKLLLGQTDPNVTALHGNEVQAGFIGTFDGKINGIAVLPDPIVYIAETKAWSAFSEVLLPLKPINLVRPATQTFHDHRVTAKLLNKSLSEVGPASALTPDAKDADAIWIGLRCDSPGPIFLRRPLDDALPLYMATILVGKKLLTLEKALASADTSAGSISQLEEFAVLAKEWDETSFLKTAATFLSRVWDARRIDDLLRAGGPRSLKVLTVVSPYIDIEKSRLLEMAHRLESARDVVSCDVILWLFEHGYGGMCDMPLPLASLQPFSSITITRFARNIVRVRGGASWLLNDISRALSPDGIHIFSPCSFAPTSATASPIATCSLSPSQIAGLAIKLLLAALDLADPVKLPQTESQLIQIVQMVVPAIHSRVTGAKTVLTKLLAKHLIQYHKGKQRILVPTLDSEDQIAMVFSLDQGARCHKYVLRWPQSASTRAATKDNLVLGFSGDGKTVNGMIGAHKMIWTVSSGLRSFFSSATEVVDPMFI